MSDPVRLRQLVATGSVVERALAQRASWRLIGYDTWVEMTLVQRERIGHLSDDRAERILKCSNCVAWLESSSLESATCGSCRRQWRAIQ